MKNKCHCYKQFLLSSQCFSQLYIQSAALGGNGFIQTRFDVGTESAVL